jgi:Protein of unknown function (DUF3060)
MDPQDDPEARIRELERPLADTARTSELGSAQPPGGYTYPPRSVGPPAPPPPAPYNYGGSFLGTPPRSPSTTRVWWMLTTFFVIGMVSLVGGITAYSAHRLSRGGFVTLSPSPSISPNNLGPNGTLTPGAGPSPSPAQPIPPPGGNLTVSGMDENQTMTCNDSAAIVNGISNTVVISGHCARLTVLGVQNSVTVDTADTIEASGFDNHVTYHSGSPSVTKTGDSNVVQQG